MHEVNVQIRTPDETSVLTRHGEFRIANPSTIVPGRIHVVRYHPADQFARITAVCDLPTGLMASTN